MSCNLNKGQVQNKSTNKILPYNRSIEQTMILVYTLLYERTALTTIYCGWIEFYIQSIRFYKKGKTAK